MHAAGPFPAGQDLISSNPIQTNQISLPASTRNPSFHFQQLRELSRARDLGNKGRFSHGPARCCMISTLDSQLTTHNSQGWLEDPSLSPVAESCTLHAARCTRRWSHEDERISRGCCPNDEHKDSSLSFVHMS